MNSVLKRSSKSCIGAPEGLGQQQLSLAHHTIGSLVGRIQPVVATPSSSKELQWENPNTVVVDAASVLPSVLSAIQVLV
jgi:hypothetical protein